MTPRFATVEQLRAVLDQLRPSDVLYTNEVSNLAVVRDEKYIAYIGFANVEIHDGPDAKLEIVGAYPILP